MIGVIARPEDARWAAEFFELFKTPWEPWREDGRYPAVLCAGVEPPPVDAPVLVVYGSRELEMDRALNLEPRRAADPARLRRPGQTVPVYGECLAFSGGSAEAAVTGGGAAAVRVRRGEQAVVRVGFDLFGEVQRLLTLGQPPEQARTPTLDWHIEWLREWLASAGVVVVEIPPVPAGHPYTACLTHDVDHPEIRRHRLDHTALGFLGRAVFGSVVRWLGGRLSSGQALANWAAALKWPWVHLGLARDFWRSFARYLELEQGLGSTFFVIPEKGNPGREVNRPLAARRASPYGAADIAGELRAVIVSGGEVGVHGLDAWLDAESGRREAGLVAAAAGRDCAGSRMHWLCWRAQSPAALEGAGFAYDSTVGYNECVGYRAGTAQVFRPEGVERLLELPLIAMDTALFYPGHLNLTPGAAARVMGELRGNLRAHGGVLTVNWHDRSLAPERQWEGPYRALLEELRRDNAWRPTAARAVAWFRRRRDLKFERARDADGAFRLRVTGAGGGGEGLPGFRLRVRGRGGAMKEYLFERELETNVTPSA